MGTRKAAIGRMKKHSISIPKWKMNEASNSSVRKKSEIAHIKHARQNKAIECFITETAFFDIPYHFPKNGGGFGSSQSQYQSVTFPSSSLK